MAIDERLAARVRTILAGREDVEEKAMMGRLAFMVAGSMCCTVGEGELLVRVREAERSALLEDPRVSPMQMGTRVMRGFVRVSPAATRTQPALEEWVTRGIAAGAEKTKSRTPTRRGTGRRIRQS